MEVPDSLREYWIEEARERQRMIDESPEPTEEDMDELPNWACYYINRIEAERDEALARVRELEAAADVAAAAHRHVECERDDAREALSLMRSRWRHYVRHLEKKYPPAEGEEFLLTCPHHKAIDDVLEVMAKPEGGA